VLSRMPKPPRSPEWLQNLTDQHQKTASPVVPSFPLSLSSSSDSNSESNSGSSDSESSEPAVKERSRQRSTNRNLRNQVIPSLREWGDWKREIGNERLETRDWKREIGNERLETRDRKATHAETGRGSGRATRSRDGASSWRG
jgi:hypothetical protein